MAILFVLLYHYVSTPPGGSFDIFRRLFAIGWSGVDLFFVLSGFLIGGILLDERESSSYFKTFYGRRVYRIMPLYYLWVGVYFFLGVFRTNLETWKSVPVYALFLQNSFRINHDPLGMAWLSSLWSLAVEEQFYLFIPLAIRLLSPRKLLWLLWAAVVGAPVLRVILHQHLLAHPAAPYMLTACRADVLAMGVLLAVGWRSDRLRAAFYRNQILVLVTFAVLLLAFLCLAGVAPSFLSWMMASWGFSCIGAFYASLLAIAIIIPKSALVAVCRWPFLSAIGRVSYCIYVIHAATDFACHKLVFHRLPAFNSWGTAGVTTMAAVLCYGLAVLSWKLFESPLLHRGHTRFKY